MPTSTNCSTVFTIQKFPNTSLFRLEMLDSELQIFQMIFMYLQSCPDRVTLDSTSGGLTATMNVGKLQRV